MVVSMSQAGWSGEWDGLPWGMRACLHGDGDAGSVE